VPFSDAAHSPQNLAVGELVKPQLVQRFAAGAPHWTQNFSPSAFSKPHLEQLIGLLAPETQLKYQLQSEWRARNKRLTAPVDGAWPDKRYRSYLA